MTKLMKLRAIFAIAAFGAAGGSVDACESYDAIIAAVQAGDRAEVERLYQDVAADQTCGTEIRDWAGVYLARQLYRDGTDETRSPDDRRDALQSALTLETHWRTMAALGRLEFGASRYDAAAEHFRMALTEIAEGDPAHAAEPDEIAEVRASFTDALSLSGAEAGAELFRTNYRGFQITETSLPITFLHDSAEFDVEGRRYAEELLKHVLDLRPKRIELDGHTDPQGGEQYNYRLSVARAEAVRQFLLSGGFGGEVVVRGYGETQVPDPPEGVEAGSAEHYRIARRVTFRADRAAPVAAQSNN